MIKINIITPNSKAITGETDFVVCKTDEGEIGFQVNHTPLIGKITKGQVRYNNIYVAVINGIIDFNNNELNIICQDAYLAKSYEEALELYEEEQKKILSESKRKLVDFTQAEKDLAKSIKEAGLGKIKG